MIYVHLILVVILCVLPAPSHAATGTLSWPIGCVPGINCLRDATFRLGYPDIEGAGRAFDCGPPGYVGHTGTDITVSSVDDGVEVFAADDGEVLWVSGGKYDRCPNNDEPDCNPELQPVIPGLSSQTPTCNDFGPSCGALNCCLAWGFNAGNFVLIKHDNPDAAITFYAHLRKGSIIVANGQRVKKGDKIAEVGSSGASLTPHLHFGVWQKRNDRFELADPWSGKCGPNFSASLWQFNPPYRSDITITKRGAGTGVVSTSGGELSCGSSCTGVVTPGTRITLHAIPYSGSVFAGWEGNCRGTTANSCTIVADGSISVTAIFRDAAPPTVRSLTLPSYSAGLTVPVTSFSATDNVKITGYLLTENPAPPIVQAPSWSSSRPESYTCTSPGTKTIYAWVKDAAGNISLPARASITCGAQASAQSQPTAPLSSPRLP